MARKKQQDPIEETIRLSSDVTIVVKASSAQAYDTLDISRIGGVVTVALPGASAQRFADTRPFQLDPKWGYVATGETDNMLPSNDPAILAARARLLEQFPAGASGAAPAPVSRAVTADELAAQQGYDTGAIQRSIAAATGGNFAGTSNEDGTDA